MFKKRNAKSRHQKQEGDNNNNNNNNKSANFRKSIMG